MDQKKSSAVIAFTAGGIFLLIIDAQTALEGASGGIELCIRTVIPSLFPLLFLCGILNSFLTGSSIRSLRSIGRLCGIPPGAESMFLIGITGGYPVGAKSVFQAYRAGVLQKTEAERMLGFCSNAGPAFLFGMTSLIFPTPAAPWLLWLIQVLCALITGMILPGKSRRSCTMAPRADNGLPGALQSALQAMASVCGWVIIFRVLLQILNRWVLWFFPAEISVFVTGILELSNGCVALSELLHLPLRFIFTAVTTVFGGCCVGLQTVSVCHNLSCKMYFTGKLIQTIICMPLSMIVSAFLFPGNTVYLYIGVLLAACTTVGLAILRKSKIYTGNSVVYGV